VHQVASRSGTEGVQLTLQFDTPVDVVQFDSFSSFRSRVHGFVGPDGRSPRKTSDGVPHLVIDQMA